jgi:hypothetical protein
MHKSDLKCISQLDRSKIFLFSLLVVSITGPGDPNFRLEAIGNDTAINLPDTLSYFEYKFTQGYWTQVEGDSQGHSRPNRIYDRLKEQNPQLLSLQIEGWKLVLPIVFTSKAF